MEDAEIKAWVKGSPYKPDDVDDSRHRPISAIPPTLKDAGLSVCGVERSTTLATSISQGTPVPQPFHQCACLRQDASYDAQQPERAPSVQNDQLLKSVGHQCASLCQVASHNAQQLEPSPSPSLQNDQLLKSVESQCTSLRQDASCTAQQPESSPSIQKDELSRSVGHKSEVIDGQGTQVSSLQSSSREGFPSVGSSTDQNNQQKAGRRNMTSCKEAAMIIASMHSGLTFEEISTELGCPPGNDCYADNLTIFKVMDR